jgi:hypothetical protein
MRIVVIEDRGLFTFYILDGATVVFWGDYYERRSNAEFNAIATRTRLMS